MRLLPHAVLFTLLPLALLGADTPTSTPTRVKSLKITVLSTMLADRQEIGEWGFAALVEVDGHRILFDTGAHTDVVQRNAESMNIDLSTVPEVVLSHSHWDHVGGFLTLRDAVKAKNPAALARTHVGDGIFWPRVIAKTGVADNPLLLQKADYEKGGGVFVVHAQAVQLYPGVWLTGPVPRKYPEHNWSPGAELVSPNGPVEDNLPEDMSLVCDTDAGLVVLTGCGHAGVANIIDHARSTIRHTRVHALIGGIHLFNASEETLRWTAAKLNEVGVDNFLGAHCTGVETVYRYRHDLGLDRAHAVVAAVGAVFELGKGIDPGVIAR
ncbi:MAG TPA: MBL fold metallo-hydrolase [Candidatus Didemnitutus sp.]|nr:MBL fold metallo-hydrolase [Candidatus Didemnitutus sp.]